MAEELSKATERRIDRWVEDLKLIVLAGNVAMHSRAGEYVIDNICGGDIEAAISQRGDKADSLRALAKRADEFGMTPSGVRVSVRIALQVRLLGEALSQRLTIRHHRALLPLKDEKEKRRLALAAANKGWTTKDLAEQVAEVHEPHAGGRPETPILQRLLEQTHRKWAIQNLHNKMSADADQIPAHEMRRLLDNIDKLRADLTRCELLLTTALKRAQ